MQGFTPCGTNSPPMSTFAAPAAADAPARRPRRSPHMIKPLAAAMTATTPTREAPPRRKTCAITGTSESVGAGPPKQGGSGRSSRTRYVLGRLG